MDIFMEYIVKHKKNTKDYLIAFGLCLAAALVSFITVLFFKYTFGFGLLIIAGAVYGAYFLIKSRSLEFEYILTNSELDIDKIMARSRRKRVGTIDFKEIEICAPVDSPDHKYEYEHPQGVTKTLDCSGMGDTPVYFVDCRLKEEKTRILIQPPVKMMEAAQKFNPRRIFIAQ